MKTICLAALLVFNFPSGGLAEALLPQPTGERPGWKSVEKILGRSGKEQGDGFWVDFPRTDLNVMVQGVPLEPGLALTSRFFFKPLAKGTLLTGDLVLLEQEVPQVTVQLKQNGFHITAVHPFLFHESPPVYQLHIKGEGSRANLAQALQRVLSAKPLNESAPAGAAPARVSSTTPLPITTASPTPSPTSVWAGVEAVLGPGIVTGKVLSYEYPPAIPSNKGFHSDPEMGIETTFRFQKVYGAAVGKKGLWGFGKGGGLSKDIVAGTGEFLLTADQVEVVKKRLARNHVKVTYQRELERSSGVLLYFWVLGPSSETAEGLKEALAMIASR